MYHSNLRLHSHRVGVERQLRGCAAGHVAYDGASRASDKPGAFVTTNAQVLTRVLKRPRNSHQEPHSSKLWELETGRTVSIPLLISVYIDLISSARTIPRYGNEEGAVALRTVHAKLRMVTFCMVNCTYILIAAVARRSI